MPNRAPELAWDESETASDGLTRTAIVRAAIELADTDGLDAVSMRRLAAKLDARPMSLYTHVASKDDLLDLMLNEIIGEVLVPEPLPEHWRDALSEVARYSYRAFKAHPWTLEAFGGRAHFGPSVLRHAEQSVAAVAPLGLEPADAWRVLGTVDEFTLGHAVRGVTFEAIDVRDSFPDIDPERYPALAAMGIPSMPDPDAAFEAGLEIVLDGIEKRFGKP